MHLVDDVLNHFPRRILADLLTVGPGVEIEMDAEEGIGPFWTLRLRRLDRGSNGGEQRYPEQRGPSHGMPR